jgi:hypothetical protein
MEFDNRPVEMLGKDGRELMVTWFVVDCWNSLKDWKGLLDSYLNTLQSILELSTIPICELIIYFYTLTGRRGLLNGISLSILDFITTIQDIGIPKILFSKASAFSPNASNQPCRLKRKKQSENSKPNYKVQEVSSTYQG